MSSQLPARSDVIQSVGCSALLVLICLLATWQPLRAQVPGKPLVVNKTPRNLMLVIVAYEMDKAIANSLLQKEDLVKNASSVARRLMGEVKSQKATLASCIAVSARGGSVVSYDSDTASVLVEGIINPPADKFHAVLKYQHKATGISITTKTILDTHGGVVFLGSVPDSVAGKDQLIFAQCLIHFLK